MQSTTFDRLPSVEALKAHYDSITSKTHLRALLQDEARNAELRVKYSNDFLVDFTHTKIDSAGLQLLMKVGQDLDLPAKIRAMFNGDIINPTEKRQVWHVKLREMEATDETSEAVLEVRQRIKKFSDSVRSKNTLGFSRKVFNTVVAIGIGGSYLGPEFVHEALRFSAQGRQGKAGI